MFRRFATTALLGAACLLMPAIAAARDLGVEISTNRGHEAVYQPGETMQIKVRTTDDAYLLVYEIDSEGVVRVLFPEHNADAQVEGHHMLELPLPDSNLQLVVESSTGQSFLVAIASRDAFQNLPWYLRPANPQGDELGYVDAPQDEEGVTQDGHIVGDPFVAMERIRRRVLAHPDDVSTFGTAYTSYYVEHQVRYPRYLCYDCHRPDYYAWWDGFDPYYTTCSVFDVRVNWRWHWGPSYWLGAMPYYVYVGRPGCPPRYVSYCAPGFWFSSWDGWGRWCSEWGNGGLRRFKSAPPPGYIPPTRYGPGVERTPASFVPPGYMVANTRRYRGGSNPALPIGRNGTPRPGIDDAGDRGDTGDRRVSAPPRQVRPGGSVERTPVGRSDGSGRNEGSAPPVRAPRPSFEPRQPATPPATPPREERPAPSAPPRNDPPPPPQQQRNDPPAPAPARPPRNDPGQRMIDTPTPRTPSPRALRPPAPGTWPPRSSSESLRQYRSWMSPRFAPSGGAPRTPTVGSAAGYRSGGVVREGAYRNPRSGSAAAPRFVNAPRGAGGGGGGAQRVNTGGGPRGSSGGGQRAAAGGASAGRGGWSSRSR